MRSLPKPVTHAVDVLEQCAVTITDVAFRGRLGLIADNVELAEEQYDQRGIMAELFRLAPTDGVNGLVSTDEMVWVYDNKLSKEGQAARRVYDAIRAAPRYGLCPLCGHRVVSTVDHYLSKTIHPVYAVTPLNLVPACADCNKLKQSRQPANASDQTLHPYFDIVDDRRWLRATLIESLRPAVVFFADPTPNCGAVKCDRISLHFRTFGLATLYAANAGQELAGIRHELVTVGSAGAAAVRDHLEARAVSWRQIQQNSWQTAMYEALFVSDWFCQGGYLNLPI